VRQSHGTASKGAAEDAAGKLVRDDALRLLEDLAQAPGLLGITARFAKSRFLLSRK
jgi:hypothetical protein